MSRALFAISLAVSACTAEPAGRATEAVVGGQVHEGTPGVVFVESQTGRCTGFLVGVRTVFTAGHCVDLDLAGPGAVADVAVYVGAGEDAWQHRLEAETIQRHPDYGGIGRNDIALLRLQAPAPPDATPVEIDLEPLGALWLGREVRVVGFGVDDPDRRTGAGVKREVRLAVDEVFPALLGLGDADRNACEGDSGAPVLAVESDGVERAIALISYGAEACRAPSRATRLDVQAGFVARVLDAWEGVCQADGVCEPDRACPRTPDPDCDPCQLDGACARDCEPVDLDCAPGPIDRSPGCGVAVPRAAWDAILVAFALVAGLGRRARR